MRKREKARAWIFFPYFGCEEKQKTHTIFKRKRAGIKPPHVQQIYYTYTTA